MLIEFDPDAESEYAEAVEWYSRRSPRTALRFEAAVNAAIAKIIANPEQFPQTYASCRRCLLRPFPFSIIFQVKPGKIKIAAVAHAKRETTYWWRRV